MTSLQVSITLTDITLIKEAERTAAAARKTTMAFVAHTRRRKTAWSEACDISPITSANSMRNYP